MKYIILTVSLFFLTGFNYYTSNTVIKKPSTVVFTKVSEKEIDCMAKNIYFEARDQIIKGQISVALVTINRVRSKRFPNTICEVVKQANRDKNGNIIINKCHFSWYCDGLSDKPKDKLAWKISKLIARSVLKQPGAFIKYYGEKWNITDFLGGATHYHRVDVNPYWNRNMLKIARIGDHVFYIDPYR